MASEDTSVGQGGVDLKFSSDAKGAKKAMKAMDTNGDGIIDSTEIVAYAVKGEKRKTWISILVILLIIVVAVCVTLIVLLVKENKDSQSKNEAIESMGHVSEDIISTMDVSNISLNSSDVYNLTDDETSILSTAFSTFDDDGDESWSLDEFTDYLSYSVQTDTVFDTIDIDSDTVWSFREMVAFLEALNQTSIYANNLFNHILFPATSFRYDINNNSEDYVFFEYAAALLFEIYDPDYKGYVTFDQYITNNANATFIQADSDGDNLISFEEFIHSSFTTSGLALVSLSGLLDVSNHYNISNVSQVLGITDASVTAYDLYDCPNMNLISSYYYDVQTRRRKLNTATTCSTTGGTCAGVGIGCGICIFFTLGACGPPCAIAIGGSCTAFAVACPTAAASGGCLSADSIVFAYNDVTDTINKVMVNDVHVGDKIVTVNGLDSVIHTAHYIRQDSSENFMYQRRLCYHLSKEYKCITMSYHHMLFINDLNNLQAASSVNIGDIVFVPQINKFGNIIEIRQVKYTILLCPSE